MPISTELHYNSVGSCMNLYALLLLRHTSQHPVLAKNNVLLDPRFNNALNVRDPSRTSSQFEASRISKLLVRVFLLNSSTESSS